MRFRWQNFRCFEDTGWINLRPLTVVIGRNNTGKTSTYEPLLLLKQTMDSRFGTQALVTKGPLADLGHYEDIVYGRHVSRDLTFELSGLQPNIEWPSGLQERMESREPDGVSLTFSREPKSDVVLSEYKLKDPAGKALLTRRRRRGGSYTMADFPRFPALDSIKPPLRDVFEKVKHDIYAHRPLNFLFAPRDVLGDVLTALDSDTPVQSLGPVLNWIMEYTGLTSIIGTAVIDNLSRLSYLGPLRALPKRWYELSGEMPATVGEAGKNSPELLFRLQDTSLLTDVSGWLRTFGFSSLFEFDESGSDGFAVKLRRTKNSPAINVADCGMGVSQVLPLIVQGFHGSQESLLVVEQPEIHLNPSLQACLAELFVAFVDRGRKMIVETHSEHFLLRLRRLIANDDIDPEDVAVYFTDKKGDGSTLRRIEIDSDGNVSRQEWPKGFFDESLTEALALAATRAKKRHGA